MSSASSYHVPVLLRESVEGLGVSLRPNAVYVDCTFGGGGHSRAILERLGPHGRLIAFDLDPDAAANAPADPRFTLVADNFSQLEACLLRLGLATESDGTAGCVTGGILADLGVSSHQLDTAARGFSFRADAPLDLRLGPTIGPSAAELIDRLSAEALADILRSYGELSQAGRLSRAVLAHHAARPIRTTGDLVAALEPHFPRPDRNARLAQAFQALRIAVNGELDALEQLLATATHVLAPEARLVVISYHSLEDRRVKHVMASGRLDGREPKDFYGSSLSPYRVITRRVMVAGADELARNPRSRSARLRVAERNLLPPTA